MVVPTFLEPDSLFSALNDVLILTSSSDVEPTLLLSVVLRMVEAIAKILDRIVVRQAANLPTDIDVLETLGILLHHVLSGVLPLLTSLPQHSTRQPANPISDLQGPITVLLERLTTLVFNPLIRAFCPLSEAYLNALLLPPIASAKTGTNATNLTNTGIKPPVHASTQPSLVDIRADVLSLFRNIISLIDGQLHGLIVAPKLAVVVHTLRASLILETARELERLLVPVTTGSPGSGSEAHTDTTAMQPQMGRGPGTTERVGKLATKDTFWYLCTVLHILLSESSASSAFQSVAARINHDNMEDEEEAEAVRSQGGAEQLLNDGISDTLLKLITRCRKRVSSCGHGYLGTANGIHRALEIDRDREKDATDSHVQGNDTDGRGKDDGQLLNEVDIDDLGERIQQEALHTTGTVAAVNSHIDRGAIAGGRLGSHEGHDAISMPQCQAGTLDPLECHGGHDMIDLDEVSHEMLLGVIERYWVWSKS
jgi:hypothetical protein